MNKEKFNTIRAKKYNDIPEEVKELITPIFETAEVREYLRSCYMKYSDRNKICSVQQQRNTFCHGFKIRYLKQPDDSSRLVIIFDILCPATAIQDGAFLINVAAEITQDKELVRMIYVCTYAPCPDLCDTFVERKSKISQEHTLDFITPEGVERQVNHMTPNLSPGIFNEIKSLDDLKSEEKNIIKNLKILGQHRIDKCSDMYSDLLGFSVLDNGPSKKLACQR